MRSSFGNLQDKTYYFFGTSYVRNDKTQYKGLIFMKVFYSTTRLQKIVYNIRNFFR